MFSIYILSDAISPSNLQMHRMVAMFVPKLLTTVCLMHFLFHSISNLTVHYTNHHYYPQLHEWLVDSLIIRECVLCQSTRCQ